MSIRAGDLSSRVEIQRETPVDKTDRTGQTLLQWATYKTRWCSIEFTGGGEQSSGQQVQALHTHKFVFRDGPESTKERLKLGERIFQVDAIDDMSLEDGVIVLAKEQPRKTP